MLTRLRAGKHVLHVKCRDNFQTQYLSISKNYCLHNASRDAYAKLWGVTRLKYVIYDVRFAFGVSVVDDADVGVAKATGRGESHE